MCLHFYFNPSHEARYGNFYLCHADTQKVFGFGGFQILDFRFRDAQSYMKTNPYSDDTSAVAVKHIERNTRTNKAVNKSHSSSV